MITLFQTENRINRSISMEHHLFLIVNTALIFSCACLAIVFLVLPLPPSAGIRKYRLSLRFLAGAYLMIAVFKTYEIVFHLQLVNFISIERLTIASLQALLFTFTLITLLNPRFITRPFLYKQLMPIVLLVIAYIPLANKWGDPVIPTFSELLKQIGHPVILLREIFLLYYLFQLYYLTRLFKKQAVEYTNRIDNYFADSSMLRLTWVKYCFFAALTVGICTLLSCFLFTELLVLYFNIAYGLFYFVFSLCYIQYPQTFIYIEPVIYTKSELKDESVKNNKRLVWNELKLQILEAKYFLKTGVNIEDMAHYLKIGRTSLSLFINNEEGMNFNAWINSLRIEEAKDLLLRFPEYNLIDISEMVGYSESSNFSRQFKLITNESPSSWRQSAKAY